MALDYVRTLRRFNRNARLVFLSAALTWFSTFGIYSVLFNLYVLRLHYGPQFVGIVNASGLLSGAVFSLSAGELGRRLGSRRAMIIGLAMATLGYGLVPAAQLLPSGTRAIWLAAAYFCACLGTWAVYIVNVSPFLVSVTGAEERSHAFSVLMALSTAAAFVGALVGGMLPTAFAAITATPLTQPTSYGLSLLCAALLLIPATLAIASTCEPAGEERAGSMERAGDDRRPLGLMAMVAAVLFIRAAGQGSARVFVNVYMDAGLHMPTALIGTLAALGQLIAVPGALATPILATRWGNPRTYVIAVFGASLSLLLLALVPRWEAAALGSIGVTAMFAIASPALTTFEQSLVSQQWRPAMEGTVMMSVNLGRAAMAACGGYIIGYGGYGTLFAVGSALMAAGALAFWSYFRRPRGELAAQVDTTGPRLSLSSTRKS